MQVTNACAVRYPVKNGSATKDLSQCLGFRSLDLNPSNSVENSEVPELGFLRSARFVVSRLTIDRPGLRSNKGGRYLDSNHRVMQIEEQPDAVVVHTTDIHLPRRIGEQLRRAYKGDLDIRYEEETYFVRVNWQRVE